MTDSKHKLQKMKNLFILLLLPGIISGCASKFLSSKSNSQQIWDSIPSHKELSIRVRSTFIFNLVTNKYNFENKKVNELFSETIVEKLESKRMFDKIYVISENETSPTDLLLEIDFEYYNKEGWFNRAYGDAPSSIGILGRMIEVKRDKAILTYEKLRSARGGISPPFFQLSHDLILCGVPTAFFSPVGMWLFLSGAAILTTDIILSPFTPSEKKLIKKFMEWYAEDIVKMIEKSSKK